MWPQPGSQDIRGLSSPDQRAGQDCVDRDAEDRQPAHDLLKPIDALRRERPLPIVGPLLAAFRGAAVANQVEGEAARGHTGQWTVRGTATPAPWVGNAVVS